MQITKDHIALPLAVHYKPDDYIIFQHYFTDDQGRPAVAVEGKTPPKGGPPEHVHLRQDEFLRVISGTMGIKEPGKPERFITAGETVLWEAGVTHKFWNGGEDTLHYDGWVSPVDSFVFLLSEIHKAVYAGNYKPSMFDIAFLMRKYRSEFRMTEIPGFVQATYFPFMVSLGKLLGKYEKYNDAPEPVR